DILREKYPQLQEHLVEADVILVSSGNIGQLIDNLESVHFDRAWIKSESIENFYYDYAGNLMVYEPGDYRASHYVLSDEVGNFSINANGKIIPPLSYYKGAGDDYFIDSAETTISLKETPTALQLQNV